MARTHDRDLAPILDAIVDWRDSCLLDDGSLFSDQHIWTKGCLGELDRHFVQASNPGTGSFLEKLKLQIGSAPSDAKKLAAEMFWVMFTFPSQGIKAETKRKQIINLWSWSGEDLDSDHRLLGAPLEYGVGSPGQGYNQYRWAELSFFISAIGEWKNQSPGDQKHLLSDPWIFGNWLDGVKGAANRQLRHILLYLLFPDYYERIATGWQKTEICKTFSNILEGIDQSDEQVTENSDWVSLDRKLYSIRKHLEASTPNQDLDFYWTPLYEKWHKEKKPVRKDTVTDKASNRFWVEVTKVSGRPNREHGEHALGKALWSPQTATDQSDIYKNMRRVRPGDIVLHLIDNERISGVSVAETSADDTFMCLDGTEWEGRSGYRIPLSDYVTLEPPIHRDEVFKDDAVRAELSDILQHHKGLFYSKNLELNQGTYLTEAPKQLVQILNKLYREATGQSLPHLEELEPLTRTEGEAVGYEEPPFEEIVAAIEAEGMRLPEMTVARYHLSLKTRGFVILSGNSGTGKTWLADSYARAAGAESLIVPVAPNWTTNEDLLGYFNPLDETYHDTPFSAFLKRGEGEYRRARENRVAPRPFHLILDEMNLARVEYYFAKFLSAMEIRARTERRAEIELSPGITVQLPPNLFFVGTVNVDETTHAFADKVYDRAQMLEIQSPRELIKAHLRDAQYADLVMRVWDAVKDVAPFAYRVIDEISKYVEEASALGIDWSNALDHQLEQKVLTKVKGADPRIEAALNALIDVSVDVLPGTHAKAQEMLRQYQHHGFTSFF